MKQLKKTNSALRIILAMAMTLSACPSLAAVPQKLQVNTMDLAGIQYSTEFVVRNGSDSELDLSYISHLTAMARRDLKMSVADVIPTNMKTSESESKIARQIIGHSLVRWVEGSTWARDNIGEALQALEAPLQSEVTMKDRTGHAHKVNLNMKATRAIASVNYSGWVNASLAYQITSRTLGFEVSKMIARGQKVIFTATTQPEESRQIVGYQLEW